MAAFLMCCNQATLFPSHSHAFALFMLRLVLGEHLGSKKFRKGASPLIRCLVLLNRTLRYFEEAWKKQPAALDGSAASTASRKPDNI